MKYNINIPEIGAEFLLNYLYPELEEAWIVNNEGTFYRNYNNDTLSLNPQTGDVKLARDGFLKLLPQGFISTEEELRGGDKIEKHKEIEKRKQILKDAFLPFDTFAFRRNLKIEREFSKILNQKLDIILKNYFSFDIEKEKNEYVKEVAVLLPFVRNRRGDLGFIRNLLSSITNCHVDLLTGRFSSSDSTKEWLPYIRYELQIKELTTQDYNKLKEELSPLSDFIKEWFIPAEVHCEILIKDHSKSFRLGNTLTLDYNTQLY